jgi:inner membrane protein
MITLGIIGFLIGFIGIVSHLVGDVLTPMGIEPFYPIKKTNYSLEKINASNKLYNYIFLFIGSVFSLISFYIARFFANFV